MDGENQPMEPNDAPKSPRDSDATNPISRKKGARPARPKTNQSAKSDATSSRPRELRPKAAVDVLKQEENVTSIYSSAPVPIKRLRKSHSTNVVPKPALFAVDGLGPLRTSGSARHDVLQSTARHPAVAHPSEPAELKGLESAAQDFPKPICKSIPRAEQVTKDVPESTANNDQISIDLAAAQEPRVMQSPGEPWLQPMYQYPASLHVTSRGQGSVANDPPAELSTWTGNPDDDLPNHLPPSVVTAQGAEMSPFVYEDSDGNRYRKSGVKHSGVFVDMFRHEIPWDAEEPQYKSSMILAPTNNSELESSSRVSPASAIPSTVSTTGAVVSEVTSCTNAPAEPESRAGTVGNDTLRFTVNDSSAAPSKAVEREHLLGSKTTIKMAPWCKTVF